MPQLRDNADGADTLATQASYVLPSGTPTDDEFELIRSKFIDERKTDASPKDLFAFELIACSDGLDSYFTRHDIDTGLKHFVSDLEAGQSVLGNHDYRTFSYGSSYQAFLEQADPKSPVYEATAFRQFNDPALRTAQWVRGKYYIVRGVELNDQPSDSLIRAMEFGGVRKTSITFSAGEFICSVCDQELLAGLWDWDDEDACTHFPGVTYERDDAQKLCWALMKQEELFETSMVYKNASPSSMYLRKAAALATAGLLPGKEIVALEQRLNMRLPQPEGVKPWVSGVGTAKEDRQMATKRHPDGGQPADETVEEPATTDPAITDDPASEPAPETPETPDSEGGGDGGETPEHEEATDELRAAATRVYGLRTQLGTEQLEVVADVERQLERMLADADSDRSVGAMTARQYETRDRAIQEVLGEAPTVERIRSLQDRAGVGETLYGELVTDAVAARVRAVGEEKFSTEHRARYEKQLRDALDPAFVRDEAATWEELAKARFTPGRQVQPKEPADAPRSALPKDVPAKAPEISSDGQVSTLPARK